MVNEKSKVIGIYLPQFHETEDNNKWWGNGFTDWNSVQMAEPCFKGHKSPWAPLNKNYYDLNTYETMLSQANLAKKYGIEGFCFYHYYFADGKKELEQPAENLLKWKDIDMPFCFNWASESWIKSWSRIDGNVWSEKFEQDNVDSSNGILVRQDYGDQYAWKKHFEYLLPFFRDPRYITVHGKPVFIFYRPDDIPCLREMAIYWRKLAKDCDLEGLYLIGVNTNVLDYDLDAALVYEPRTSINRLNDAGKVIIKNGVRCFEYKDVWNELLDDKGFTGCKTFFSGVSGYDDTPRRGMCGECIVHKSVDIYENGMRRLIEKSTGRGNEFVFVNAWNEWGEGMYLEPDEEDEFKYLEATKRAIMSAKQYVQQDNNQLEEGLEEIKRLRSDVRKYKSFVMLFDKWLEVERLNKFNLKKYFESEGVRTIAIYGMATMGKQFYLQLQKENITPTFGIDRYVGQYGRDFKIIRPEDDFPHVDAIVVTTYNSEDIICMIKDKTNSKIYTLEHIIDYFWRDK